MARNYKRDGKGRFARTNLRNAAKAKKKVRSAAKAANNYRKAGHSGAGAISRRTSDRYHSRGAFATNRVIRKGKRPTKATRAYRKASVLATTAPAVHYASKARGRRAARKNGFAA